MNDFDFLSRVPVGQYIPTGSAIHRMDPRAKIIIFTLLIIALTFTPSRIGLGIGIIFLLLSLLLSKVNLGYALKGLLPPLPFLLIIAIIQVLFYSSAADPQQLFSIGPVHITLTGVWAGLMLLIRFSALILALSLASFCTSTSELIHGMQKLLNPLTALKIQTMDLIMVVQVTLRFLPFLAQSAERIAKAQASRGADWGVKSKGLWSRIKQIIPLIIPLFLISLRRAENLALAMDARAYGILSHRTSMSDMHFTWKDLMIVALTVMVSLAIFLV